MWEWCPVVAVLVHVVWLGRLANEYASSTPAERREQQTAPLMFAVIVHLCSLTVLWARIGIWCGR